MRPWSARNPKSKASASSDLRGLENGAPGIRAASPLLFLSRRRGDLKKSPVRDTPLDTMEEIERGRERDKEFEG